MPKASRATIVQVAARAGVHAGTVSRAMTQPERVAPETRTRIEAAIDELGFVPNRAARRLITGHTGMVAVVVPDITNPYFAAIVRAIERSARREGRQVILVDTGEDSSVEVAAVASLAGDVDGFIIISPRRLHRSLDELGGRPAVFMNRVVAGHSSVVIRTAPAVADALAHLESLGHRKLAFLTGPKGSWSAVERRDVVRRFTRRHSIELIEVTPEEPTFDAATRCVDGVVRAGATALLAFNDQLALGIISGLRERGIVVPDEVSVIGCDDVPMAAMLRPALTTISLPTQAAGESALATLLGATSGRELTGSFIVRQSTAPAGP